jgi:hypothetical protein
MNPERGTQMKPFQVIFFHFITFIAGGMCFINMSELVATNPDYEPSWYKVAATIIIGIAGAMATHAERHPYRR